MKYQFKHRAWRIVGLLAKTILKSDQVSERLLLAAQFGVWVRWHIHQCGGGKETELDRNTTCIWNEYGTYIGNVGNTLLQMTYRLTWRWMQTTRGSVDTPSSSISEPQGIERDTEEGLHHERAQRQRHEPGRWVWRQTDGWFSWGKGQRVENTIGSVTKQIGLSILRLPLETNYFAQPQTNLFSDGERKCPSCTYPNDQLQTQSAPRGTFYANGTTTILI